MRISVGKRIRVGAVSTGLFLTAFLLAGYSAKNPDVVRYGAMAVEQALRPAQALQRGIFGGIGGFWSAYLNLVGVKAENESLKARLAALEASNSRLLEVESENKRLKGLLDVVEERKYSTIAASVIAYDPSNWVQRVTIDRGSGDGVAEGMAVVQGDGVVGQVITAAYNSAQVLLITDHVSGVDAMEQNSRARGVVVGAGGGECEMRFVSREEELKVGDRVITTGVDGIYPKGLLVGIISETKKAGSGPVQYVGIKTAVDFTRLETLLVVVKAPKTKDEDARVESGKRSDQKKVKK